MADETKIQWHPAFYDAMELTLIKDADSLEYEREHNLSSKPLQVDFLVIQKENDLKIEEEIARIFKHYNLVEYESPGDALNIDVYYKVVGYGCLYKSLTAKEVDGIKPSEITLTMVRNEKPEELFKKLEEYGVNSTSTFPGIYHLSGNVLFDTQIVATRELPKGSYIWLKALTRDLNDDEAKQFTQEFNSFKEGSRERRMADAVAQVVVSANYEVFERLKKEDPIMCDALKELMKPELNEARSEARDEDRLTQIRSLSKKFNVSYSEVMDGMDLTKEEKAKYLKALEDNLQTA